MKRNWVNIMTREEAYYGLIKLYCGDFEFYDEWLNIFLESEDPLSNIVLELIDCKSIKDAEYALRLYCLEKPFDVKGVYTRLRLELSQKYESGKLVISDVMSWIDRIAKSIPDCFFRNCAYTLSDYYCLVEDGIISAHRFEAFLRKWLKNGGRVVDEEIWGMENPINKVE